MNLTLCNLLCLDSFAQHYVSKIDLLHVVLCSLSLHTVIHCMNVPICIKETIAEILSLPIDQFGCKTGFEGKLARESPEVGKAK